MQCKLPASAGKGEKPQDQKLFDCPWKECKKDHLEKPAYRNDGRTTRSSDFADKWVAAGLEPWEKHGAGRNSFATLDDYRAETPKAAYAVPAAAMKHPEYHTQKHHIISINLFDARKKLVHNAKLVGYDVNGVANGICLPTYEVDIVRHDLQAHRGSHPNNLYNAKIAPNLEDIENESLTDCQKDRTGSTAPQQALLRRLERLARKTEQRIRSWELLLRTEALDERARARARLKALGTPRS